MHIRPLTGGDRGIDGPFFGFLKFCCARHPRFVYQRASWAIFLPQFSFGKENPEEKLGENSRIAIATLFDK